MLLSLVPLRLVQLQLNEAAFLRNHPYNSRLAERVEYRGAIYSRNRQAVALSVRDQRVYPYGSLVSHWVGYHNAQRGLAGVEAWKHELLRERRSPDGKESQPGHSVRLSVDLDVQQQLDRIMPSTPGAALVLDLDSGQLLGALSRPGFEPSRVTADWSHWQRDPQQPTFNRYGLGVYPAEEFWGRWQPELQALSHRPPLVLDWTGPVRMKDGTWLISPLQVAMVVLKSGSELPLSQLYSSNQQPWHARKTLEKLPWSRKGETWSWSEVGHFGSQTVAWGLCLRATGRQSGYRLSVVVLENCQDPARAQHLAREALR